MVTSEHWPQRWLHMLVGAMRGRSNTCLTQQKDGSYKPKVRYNTQPTAAKSASALTEKTGRQFDAYRCWFCEGFHIGGAANLTAGKVLTIFLVWLFGRKRAGNKHRLKWRVAPAECGRCRKATDATIMSMYSAEMICKDCKAEEEKRPDYDAAVKADEEAVREAAGR